MAGAMNSATRGPTTGFSVRMPKELRRRIRTAAGLDDMLVADWVLAKLDEAAKTRIGHGFADGYRTEAPETRELTAREVIDATASFFHFTREALATPSRRADVVVPRQIAMYLCRNYTGASVAEIAGLLGREHSSVSHAVGVITEKMGTVETIRVAVERLLERIDDIRWGKDEDGETARTG